MSLPPCQKAFERCAKALEKVGVDIYNLLNGNDESVFECHVNTFLTIVVIQVVFEVAAKGFNTHLLIPSCCNHAVQFWSKVLAIFHNMFYIIFLSWREGSRFTRDNW